MKKLMQIIAEIEDYLESGETPDLDSLDVWRETLQEFLRANADVGGIS